MILKEKAARWNADAEIQGLLKRDQRRGRGPVEADEEVTAAGNAKKLLDAPLDRVELAKARLPYERLDQLTMEVLMGVR